MIIATSRRITLKLQSLTRRCDKYSRSGMEKFLPSQPGTPAGNALFAAIQKLATGQVKPDLNVPLAGMKPTQTSMQHVTS